MDKKVRKKVRATSNMESFKLWASCSKCGEKHHFGTWSQADSWLDWHVWNDCPVLNFVPDPDAKLDCYFCSQGGTPLERLLRFKDFKDVALHVEQYHSNKKGEETMIRPGSYSGSQGQRGGGRKDSGPRIPFIKADNLSEEPKPARILAVKTEDLNYNNVVLLKLAFGGRTFFLGLRDNALLESLVDTLGPDEEKWVGQSFNLYAEVDDFSEKSYMRIEAASSEAKPKGGKK